MKYIVILTDDLGYAKMEFFILCGFQTGKSWNFSKFISKLKDFKTVRF